jgi:RNA polymerase sigma-70 factor (ECF subfamily)
MVVGSPAFVPVSVAFTAVDDLTRLLICARDGDAAAFVAALRLSQAETWRVVRHLVGVDDADDVTQDTYIRVWKALPRYRADATGRTWLLSIARRASVDALRRRGRHQRRVDAVAAMARVETDGHEGHLAIDALVMALPVERREAFVLTQLAGCSYGEAATVCAVPVGTIRSRVARARDHLVEMLRAAETG